MQRNACVLTGCSTAVIVLACASMPRVEALTLRSELFADGLTSPVHVTAPPGDFNRVFIVEQPGRIRIVKNGSPLAVPFLGIEDLVAFGGEQGLFSVAFHPDYASNGFFYVNYTRRADGATVIARYRVSSDPDVADPASAFVLLTIAQPYANHNGGQLAFGPKDGYLYIGMGDGGSSGDPGNRAQSDTTLLGKLLRIDVNSGSPYGIPPDNPGGAWLPEVWAKGLRNPWRFSFDRLTGDLYIADVGQGQREEIDYVPHGTGGGRNYGWRCMEGDLCTGSTGCSCTDPSLTAPLHVYSHALGCSVTGGFVYRGPSSALQGTYFFADYCSATIWSFRVVGGTVSEFTDRTAELTPSSGPAIGSISSFGEDAAGNLYICSLGGRVYAIVASGTTADFDTDGDVDLADFSFYQGCFNGPNRRYAYLQCTVADFDADNDVDVTDFATFADCFNGPNRPPGCI